LIELTSRAPLSRGFFLIDGFNGRPLQKTRAARPTAYVRFGAHFPRNKKRRLDSPMTRDATIEPKP